MNSNEDVIVWADGTWCYRYELHEMNYMSDDYRVLQYASGDWSLFLTIHEDCVNSN